MSVLGSILSKILHPNAAQAAPAAPTTAPAPSAAPSVPPPSGTAAPSPGAAPAATPTSTPAAPVDVGAVLTQMASKSGQQLNWQTSIVDLMKLVGHDSSLTARKQLAQELHYQGDTNDSATMNVWLHKQVMQKLAENGGKLPADLT